LLFEVLGAESGKVVRKLFHVGEVPRFGIQVTVAPGSFDSSSSTLSDVMSVGGAEAASPGAVFDRALSAMLSKYSATSFEGTEYLRGALFCPILE
jgi:hypothetical protein